MLPLTSTQHCKSGIAIILFPHYTTDSREIYRKVSWSLIFAVQDESAKTAKIMHLENLALYGMCVCVSNMVYTHMYVYTTLQVRCHMHIHRPPPLCITHMYQPQGRVSYQEGRGMYVWPSCIEIRYYSVTYFEFITKFNTL